MKNILNFIPGFRSGTKWKEIIAFIYYVFALLLLSEGVGLFLFLISIPFIVFNIPDIFKKKSKPAIAICVIAFILFCVGMNNINNTTYPNESQKFTSSEQDKKIFDIKDAFENTIETNKTSETSSTSTDVSGQLKIHYIDVGQADSILIQQGNNSMLIDAGNNSDSNTVKNYISSQGITKLDYVVGTHPHADHIGGLDCVIDNFEIGKIYMPKVTNNTKTFQDVVQSIKTKGMKVTAPVPGDSFKLGQASCEILAPNSSSYENLNNYSIVIKITFGDNSFMFGGDAEAVSEMEMVKGGFDVKSDVLKIGHHGSNSSTCANFLNAVNPQYAVICVGDGNKYGHPHKVTMDRLQSKGIKVYRTDECGTIICTSDGKNISFSTDPR